MTTIPLAIAVDVSATVGEFRLDVAFDLPAGVGVLFGPSGAGKSLTLAMVAGLRRPDQGKISIGGKVVDDMSTGIHIPTQQRHVGVVFQDALLLPHRSVLDNVALAAREVTGRTAKRAAARQWLGHVGAEELSQRRPRSLSGGQRQRVALARALVGDPVLLLLDEPLSALDLTVRRELRSYLRDVIVSAGIPTLIVTHDPDEAEAVGDVIMRFGPGTVEGAEPVARNTTPNDISAVDR